MSDGSKMCVAWPAEEVLRRLGGARRELSVVDGGAWVDLGSGIHVNPAHVVYVKVVNE